MQPQQKNNVIPFQGQFYPQPQSEPNPEHKPMLLQVMPMVAILACGVLLGIIGTRQSADYQRVQQLKADSLQLSNIRKEICK